MKSIHSKEAGKTLTAFTVKALTATALSVLALSLLCSEVILKLDLSLSLLKYCGIGICALSAFLISAFSVSGLKNNGAVMGLLSCLPLLLYSLFNTVCGQNTLLYFVIKSALILIVGALTGAWIAARNRRVKV